MGLHDTHITFIALNGPMCLTASLVNMFFIFCLMCPGQQNETLKQPLKVLLISLVTSNICFQLAILLYIFENFFPKFLDLGFVADGTSYVIYASLSSSMWLSIFYYTKIVQAQQVFFIWMKRNIKAIVYCGLTIYSFIFLTQLGMFFLWLSSKMSHNFTGNPLNVTSEVVTESTLFLISEILDAIYIFSFTTLMALSWSSTLVYLCRHMKRMEKSSSPFASSRLRSQLRVTIMGIIQTGLSAFYVLFVYLYWYNLCQYDQNFYAIETVYSVFCFVTTLNLGLGQSLLRKRAADVFNKIYSVCLVVRKLRPVQE
uniref:Taste receptor type 2 n=1 Tax=Scleropages formosus TaxID=113540 RepID=A0A8C9RVV7_SCLFO